MPQTGKNGSVAAPKGETKCATLDAGSELAFVCGFASASVIWFLAETTFFSLFSARGTDKVLRVINIVCGTIMISYSAKLLYSFIMAVM